MTPQSVAVLVVGAASVAIVALVGYAILRLTSAMDAQTTEIKIMSPQLLKLQQDVAAMRDVNQSAVALLTGLSTQLKDALANAKDNDDFAALDAISADLEAQTASLAAAVTSNTPAASRGGGGGGAGPSGGVPGTDASTTG